MTESPSQQLKQLLGSLRLCSPADLRRCRGHVRRLTRDLPTFDSVWIDALVHRRCLTSFQARLLESHDPERLRLGPFVLVDRLGSGSLSETFLAKAPGEQRVVVKRVPLSDELAEPALKAVAELVEVSARADGGGSAAVVIPRACRTIDGALVVVSSPVDGLSLAELLVRRGRFPHDVVREIGCQLLAGLAYLEARGLVHGDLALKNIRVTADGRAVAVDAGLLAAVRPQLVVEPRVAPEQYDAMAPERIGSGRPPDIRSDLYAAGCLMWQLLAGRPPFPTGDPLAKLALHQTRPITDVREWATETPADLADRIAGLCSRDPSDRPETAAEALEGWGPSRRSRLARFRATFNSAAPRIPAPAIDSNSRFGRPTLATVLVIGLVGLLIVGGGATQGRRLLLELTGRDTADNVGGERPGPASEQEARPADDLPAPDADGVIRLTGPGPYRAVSIRRSGPVELTGTAERRAVVEIHSGPFDVAADNLLFRHVVFRDRRTATDAHDEVMLRVEAGSVRLIDCRFEFAEEPVRPVVAVEVKGPGNVVLERVVVSGPRVTLAVSDEAGDVALVECLQLGGDSLIEVRRTLSGGSPPNVTLDHVTLRQTASLVSMPRGVPVAGLDVELRGCVLALIESGALCRIPTAETIGGRVRLLGEATLVTPGVTELAIEDRSSLERPAGFVEVEGLLAVPIRFAGPRSSRPADSIVRMSGTSIPGRLMKPPGIGDAVQ